MAFRQEYHCLGKVGRIWKSSELQLLSPRRSEIVDSLGERGVSEVQRCDRQRP